jgi:hypothetical protein
MTYLLRNKRREYGVTEEMHADAMAMQGEHVFGTRDCFCGMRVSVYWPDHGAFHRRRRRLKSC